MWQQPKTDWQAEDDVLCSDYNRIKENIEFLKELAYTLYFPFPLEDMGEDKAEEEYPYADEINRIADNLELLAAGSYHVDVGPKIRAFLFVFCYILKRACAIIIDVLLPLLFSLIIIIFEVGW